MYLRLIKRHPETPHRNRGRFGLALAVLSFVFFLNATTPVFAHRAHAGLTEIALSADGQEVEITHRLYAHDIEPRLFEAAASGWETTQQGVAKIGRYCAAKFLVAIAGEPLSLTYIGAEPDGEFIYAYFTALRPKTGTTLDVQNVLLDDAFEDQVNLVNLTLNGQTQSQYFRSGDGAKKFIWAPVAPD